MDRLDSKWRARGCNSEDFQDEPSGADMRNRARGQFLRNLSRLFINVCQYVFVCAFVCHHEMRYWPPN